MSTPWIRRAGKPDGGSGRFRGLDQAGRTEVGPVLLDVVETGVAGVRVVDDGPAAGHRDVGWPERMLVLVVDQHQEDAVFVVEWVGHDESPGCESGYSAVPAAAGTGGWVGRSRLDLIGPAKRSSLAAASPPSMIHSVVRMPIAAPSVPPSRAPMGMLPYTRTMAVVEIRPCI